MRSILLITFFLSVFLGSNENKIADYEQNRELILEAYKKNKEFILTLKSGQKYRVSEVVSINDESYQFNILKDRSSGNVFYKNNISKRSDYNYGNSSKIIIDVNANEILIVENITYQKQIKEIRNYTFIVIGMYLILSVFSN
tara:strand:+ start:2761 stop:3186 length:426 start_codon:yes stop_codon:yes gene_type:complete